MEEDVYWRKRRSFTTTSPLCHVALAGIRVYATQLARQDHIAPVGIFGIALVENMDIFLDNHRKPRLVHSLNRRVPWDIIALAMLVVLLCRAPKVRMAVAVDCHHAPRALLGNTEQPLGPHLTSLAFPLIAPLASLPWVCLEKCRRHGVHRIYVLLESMGLLAPVTTC